LAITTKEGLETRRRDHDEPTDPDIPDTPHDREPGGPFLDIAIVSPLDKSDIGDGTKTQERLAIAGRIRFSYIRDIKEAKISIGDIVHADNVQLGERSEESVDGTFRIPWTYETSINSSPPNLQITAWVEAEDLTNVKWTDVSPITINIKIDNEPPKLEIIEPREGSRIPADDAGSTKINLRGTAEDVAGVEIVQWSLDNDGRYYPAETNDKWANWNSEIEINGFGYHTITVNSKDKNGFARTVTLSRIELTRPFKPKQTKDLNELLSARSYLEDLVHYAESHAAIVDGVNNIDRPITKEILESTFYQPFEKLVDPQNEWANQQISQIRLSIEVLRKYIDNHIFGSLEKQVAYWKFDDDGTSNLVQDSSGNNNHGTLAGPTPVEGKIDGGFSFTEDSHVHINNSSLLEKLGKDDGDFSVAFWIFLRRGPRGPGFWRTIMRKGIYDDPVDPPHSHTCSIWLVDENNRIHFTVSTNAEYNEHCNSRDEIAQDRWTHVCCTKIGNKLRIFLNGSLNGETMLKGTTKSNSHPVYIGQTPWEMGFDGILDDFRIYDYPLLKPAIEHLAKNSRPPNFDSKLKRAKSDYLWAAYNAILRKIGTSYEEIRLVQNPLLYNRNSRKEFAASKLGIDLGVATSDNGPDRLNLLFLKPGQITEAKLEEKLEELFGLVSITKERPWEPTAKPEFLKWQLEYLRIIWKEQDYTIPREDIVTGNPIPIIDPDIVDRSDLKYDVPGNLAFDLWKERKEWLESEFNDLKDLREAQATAIDGLIKIIDSIIKPVEHKPCRSHRNRPFKFLECLEKQIKDEKDIEPVLKGMYLTIETFSYLLRIRDLAKTQGGVVTNDEWENVYNILLQIKKNQMYEQWRKEEYKKGIALVPDYFKESSSYVAQNKKMLTPWRVNYQSYRSWHDTLKARIDQERSVEQTLSENLRSVEEMTLPFLRDSILAALGGDHDISEFGDLLTQKLLIDIKAGSSLQTTRIEQATSTLQNLFFSLRIQNLNIHHSPLHSWELVVQDDEEHFANEWKWMGSYANWTAAMLVYFYPENVLFPSLRPDKLEGYPDYRDWQLPEFKKWINKLRDEHGQQLTPEEARKQLEGYFIEYDSSQQIPQTFKDIVKNEIKNKIRDQNLTDAKLDDLRKESEKQIKKFTEEEPNRDYPDFVRDLTEILYFVPLQIALQLQKSGHYMAALDWYQLLYAYNLPMGKRKIFYRLEQEKNKPPELTISDHWLTDWFNPHMLASNRKTNPYTRFTLMSIARCLIEYADTEFAADTTESITKARSLYITARDILLLPDLTYFEKIPVNQGTDEIILPVNPVWKMLLNRTDTQLSKIRQGRNITGTKRQISVYVPSQRTMLGFSNGLAGNQIVVPGVALLRRPTPYRFKVLIERSKELAGIAQQIESAYLSALEKRDMENYNLIKAGFDLDLSEAQVNLQRLRVVEAEHGMGLAKEQRNRADLMKNTYDDWIRQGLNVYEHRIIENYEIINFNKNWIAGLDAAIGISQALANANEPRGWIGASVAMAAHAAKAGFSMNLNNAETRLQKYSIYATHERRKQEWQLQKSIAEKDIAIADQQILIAEDHKDIVEQEKVIAETQSLQAKAVVDFLANKFTNAELYEWMSGILRGAYRYFLQQATAMAHLAQSQLTFERQDAFSQFIQSDYWQAPSSSSEIGSPGNTNKEPDRRGLTGSTRLLQDIYRLDQYAFETDKRKLNLTHTFSLARLAPFEFQVFRETGVLRFATPMKLFDMAFPGHYLRLIKRVRTSVVALIPPTNGIRASLASLGISRVTVGTDREGAFETIEIRRDPEIVALSSPSNATGVFELDMQPDILLPFESMGVDTTWEFEMPKAANQFDYNTIADVLITVEYTALHSVDYRQQVIKELDSTISGERAFSFRNELPDEWYSLLNPEQIEEQNKQMVVRFLTRREDFPSNIMNLQIENILMYFVSSTKRMQPFEITAKLTRGQPPGDDDAATSIDRIISTRRGSWRKLKTAKSPIGIWELSFRSDDPAKDKEIRERFKNGDIEDIFFIISYKGDLPEWPRQ